MRRSAALPALLLLPALLVLACSRPETPESTGATEGTPDVAMGVPVTTSSDEGREHYLLGLHLLDMGRLDEARPHFEQAVAADSSFASGYLGLANSSNSNEEFQRNLELASRYAADASEEERLFIEIAQNNFEDDYDAELAAARRLTEVLPESPRSWMALAGVQSGAGNEEEARISLARATEVAPDFAPAHMALGNSYLLEPRDLARAQQAMERAVQLEPDEAVPHDLLGDTYRAQGNLEQAAAEYTRTAELDTRTGNGFQQRGHVHSFLGNYDQARSDYDAAIQIENGKNSQAAFGVYRALVSVHEGNPQAAVQELETLVAAIDGMSIPEPRGIKIFALQTMADITLHEKMLAEAQRALERRNALLTEQAEQIGTEVARRNVRAAIALGEGQLAAARDDYTTATSKANEAMSILEPGTDPQRNEPAHELLGIVSLEQGAYDEAASHFAQADPDDPYVAYHWGLALEGAGKTQEARAQYQKVADYNFNSPGLALIRRAAIEKLG
jgi:tetratricopeptide (TPR) repeat protein